MPLLTALLGVSTMLVVLGVAGRAVPRVVPGATAVLCLAGVTAAVLAPAVATAGGPVGFAVDAVSAAMLVALFLYGAASCMAPGITGVLAFGMLAGDGVLLAAAVGSMAFAVPGRVRVVVLGAAACLAVAVLLLGGFDLRFAAMRPAGVDGVRGAAVLVLALGAAGLLSRAGCRGALMAVYLLGRVLLDLCGPATPGWWGVVVMAAAAGAAVAAGWRAASAVSLPVAADHAGVAALGAGAMGLGAALLARGADLLPLASLGVAACMLQVVGWALWGGLSGAAAACVASAVGGPELSRMGGLLRRMPATGLPLLAGLLSMAAVPPTAGFAGGWAVLQAVLGAGRAGGLAVVLLAALASAALGLVAALLAGTALRLGGTVLLGAARTAKAAAAQEPARHVRAGLLSLAAAVVVVGVVPGVLLPVVQPAARLLAGGPAEGFGPVLLAPAHDAPGYGAPVLTMLLAGVAGVAAWMARTGAGQQRALAWQGGFIEDGVGRGNAAPLAWRPRGWGVPGRVAWGGVGLAALALAVAAALGWAAR